MKRLPCPARDGGAVGVSRLRGLFPLRPGYAGPPPPFGYRQTGEAFFDPYIPFIAAAKKALPVSREGIGYWISWDR